MEPPAAPSLNSGSRSLIASMNRAREYDDMLATTTRYDYSTEVVPALPRLRYAASGTIIGRADEAGDSKRVASVAMRPAPPTMT
jgi:hypothetical protein